MLINKKSLKKKKNGKAKTDYDGTRLLKTRT